MKNTIHFRAVSTLADRFSPPPERLQRIGLAILVVLLATVGSAQAQSDAPATIGPRYSLSAIATEEIDNDRLVAVLAVRREGEDPQELARQIDRAMTEALAIVEPLAALQVQTREYRIAPVYDEKRERTPRWLGSQQMELQTADFTAATLAIERLQGILQMQDLRFSVAPETLTQASDRLIVEALERFDARARLITRTTGALTHRVVDADVSTEEGIGYAQQPRLAMRASDSRAAEAAPALAGGATRVSVSVRGRIETIDD